MAITAVAGIAIVWTARLREPSQGPSPSWVVGPVANLCGVSITVLCGVKVCMTSSNLPIPRSQVSQPLDGCPAGHNMRPRLRKWGNDRKCYTDDQEMEKYQADDMIGRGRRQVVANVYEVTTSLSIHL